MHFSDAMHIKTLVAESGMEIVELYEKIEEWEEPKKKIIARWNFVAKKSKTC